MVNNAGVAYSGPIEAFTLEQVQQQFDTNVFSVLRVNRAALPQMRKQGSGLLLQVGSIAGRLALPFLGLYGATKFALEGLTESYRYELAPFGIDAAIIEPGTYPTPISANRKRGRYRAFCPLSDRYRRIYGAVLRGEPSARLPIHRRWPTRWQELSPNQRESGHCAPLSRPWHNARLPRR